MSTTPKEAQQILNFWYAESMRSAWFSSTPAIDETIRNNYETLWSRGATGELDHWTETAKGCLALAIVLDQFPLNIYRDDPRSFSTEQKAVGVTKLAIQKSFHNEIPDDRITFLFMPLMHSEHLEDQDLCIEMFAGTSLKGNLHFAKHHKDIIERFGRFPHRNSTLGRESSPEELEYLASDQAFTG